MDYIATIATALLVALGAVGYLIYTRIQQGKSATDEKEQNIRDNKEWNKIRQWLDASLFSLVTIAEQTFGDKTGKLKLSAVLSDVIAMLPDKWRGMVSADVLTDFIEEALSAAKLAWKKNPALGIEVPGYEERAAEDGDT